MKFRRFAVAVVAMLLGIVPAERPAAASPPAGLVITNVATATYQDGVGRPLSATSNPVSVSVAAVSGAAIQSGGNACATTANPFAIGPDAVMRFTIVNTSNVTDAYRIVSATATSGTVDGIAFATSPVPIPVTLGTTVSPAVAPGGTLAVTVSLATSGIASGTSVQVALVAKTTNAQTANGVQTMSALACGLAERGPTIGAPLATQPGPPVKLVDGLPAIAAVPGAVVTYAIGYSNHGGMPAAGVVLADPVPAGVLPQPASVTIDGAPAGAAASVAGNVLTVALGTVAPGQAHVVAFSALVQNVTPGESLQNTANFTATNAPPVASTTASIFSGSANEVFDGASGAAISGATLTLLPNLGTAPVALAGVPVAPNAANADPFVTGASGTYGLGLGAAQLGAGKFSLLVAAPGYTTRRFSLALAPDAGNATYDATVGASDGAPLASPGTMSLTHASSVKLPAVYGIFGNLPLFKPESIAIAKSVDRTQASGGDRLVYTISVASASDPLGATTVVDRLPRDVLYARGTALVDGVHVEPATAGASLTWTFPTLSAAHTIVFATVVAPGAVEGATLVNVATATAVLPGAGVGTTSASASATTYVTGGLLSDRSVILGRVFVDYFGDGRFRKGDLGVAKARIFLEDGESVQTDADGLFSFPSVRPGMHTLHLDPDSLPHALEPFETRDYDDPRSPIRLVHGVFDGGLMSDVTFAVKLR